MTTTAKFTVEQLVAEVRKLANEKPGNVYEAEPEYSCSYDTGVYSDGSVGCIFGQAFQRLGVPIRGSLTIGFVICDKLGVEASKEQCLWMGHVQGCQDHGSNWARSVYLADEKYQDAFPALREDEGVTP